MNEKYKGDALLQKKFTVDYLTKSVKKNEGELPQYYVTDGHEAIIPRETYDYVQSIFKVRAENLSSNKNQPNHKLYPYALSRRIYCPICGDIYGICTGHGDRYWACQNQRKHQSNCSMYHIRFDWMARLCKYAIVMLLYAQKKKLISLLRKLSRQEAVDKGGYKALIALLNTEDFFQLSDYISEDMFAILIKRIEPNKDRQISLEFINGRRYLDTMPKRRSKGVP